MCELKSVSWWFITISILLYIIIFLLTLINMRSSLENPKEFNTFEYIEILDYTKPVNYTFLMDLNFGPDLADSDDYGLVGLIENKCYTGRCQLNFQIKFNKYNIFIYLKYFY